ncbi:MAG: NAD-binding protein [Actinomycetota bacterium]
MPNLLLLIAGRRRPRPGPSTQPVEAPSTDAVFLVLRRMRAPFVLLIVLFAIAVTGLALIPGQDGDGNTVRMSVFDAFYFMSYTATTIGFGEIPHEFTIPQRMWVTASIYSSVIGWAYAIGVLFSLIQDSSFQEALAVARFRRKVNRIREPFVVVAGYGRSGRQLCHHLDTLGRHTVVVDSSRRRIDRLAADQLATDVPALEGDVHNPTLLEMAGVLHPNCEAVVALTSSDDANLAVVMTSRLLRPGLPVIVRCDDRMIAERMRGFEPRAIINPFDLYGNQLLLSLRQPASAQLLEWLMSPPGSPLPERQEPLTDGRWVVCADGPFGDEVSADLHAAGLDVTLVDPAEGPPDVSDVVGLVAGAEADTTNLALAAHTRDFNPTVHLVVRQHHHSNAPLVDAFEPDSIFSPNDLVVRESLAWVVTPLFRSFLDHVRAQDDDWASAILGRLLANCGEATPHGALVRIDAEVAPAVMRWFAHGRSLTIDDLMRDPEDRDSGLGAIPVLLVRGAHRTFMPESSEVLERGDRLVVLGSETALDLLTFTLHYDQTLTYLVTGVDEPSSWLWRTVTARRRSRS